MSLDKFVGKREIKKTIDPGVGQLQSTPLPSDIIETREVEQPTSLRVLIEDIIATAKQVRNEILETISNVYETNKANPDFLTYASLVTESHFDPVVLIDNPSSTPNLKINITLLRKSQRKVYKNSVDPRAAQFLDLHRLLSEVGLSLYSMDRIWSKAFETGNILDDGEDSDMIRYLFFKDIQHLDTIRSQNRDIASNTLQALTSCFYSGLSDRIFRDLTGSNNRELVDQLDNVIRTLKQLNIILDISSITFNKNFEKFEDTLSGMFSNFIKYSGQRIIQEQSVAAFYGLQRRTLDFVYDIEGSLGATNCPVLRDLREQVESSVLHLLSGGEEALLFREAIMIQTKEARDILLHNTQSMSRNRKFKTIIATAISFLEMAKSLAGDPNTITNNIIAGLRETLERSESDLRAKVVYINTAKNSK